MTNIIHKSKRFYNEKLLIHFLSNHFAYVSIAAVLVITLSIFNVSFVIRNKKINYATPFAQDISGTSGAILPTKTPEQLAQAGYYNSLLGKLPIVGSGYTIDHDNSTDLFRVLLYGTFSTSLTNFSNWKAANYPSLDSKYFDIGNFTPPFAGPILVSVSPTTVVSGSTVKFTTLLVDTNGGSDINNVYFGVTNCTGSQATDGASEFGRHFSNYFAFTSNSGGTGNVSRLNFTNGCTNTLGSTPWTPYTTGSAVNLSNQTYTSKLISVTRTVTGKVLRIDWVVNLAPDFIDFDTPEFLNIYYAARDNEGNWNNGNASATWSVAGRLAVKKSNLPSCNNLSVTSVQIGGTNNRLVAYVKNNSTSVQNLTGSVITWKTSLANIFVNWFSFNGTTYYNGDNYRSPVSANPATPMSIPAGATYVWRSDFGNVPTTGLTGTYTVDLVFGNTCKVRGTVTTNNPTAVPTTAVSTPTPSPKPTFTPTPAISVINISPTADTYVSSSYPSTNYATATTLSVDYGSPTAITYMKYDLTSYTGKVFTKALLNLYVTNVTSGPLNIQATTSSWSENTVTYNTKPSLSSTIIKGFSAPTAGTWVKVDITPYINSKVGTVAAFAISETNTDGAAFNSKAASSNKPFLSVQ